MIEASVLTIRVIRNSTKPAVSRALKLGGAGVAEPAGDQGADGVGADLEDPRLDHEVGRDDQEYGDGLAERPAEPEHRAADDAAAAERA